MLYALNQIFTNPVPGTDYRLLVVPYFSNNCRDTAARMKKYFLIVSAFRRQLKSTHLMTIIYLTNDLQRVLPVNVHPATMEYAKIAGKDRRHVIRANRPSKDWRALSNQV